MNNQLINHYKQHPDLFIEEYLGVKLHWYQKVFMRAMKNVKPSNRQTYTDRIKQCQDAQSCPYDGNVKCIYAFGEDCLIKEVRCNGNCFIAERMGF